MRRLSLPPAPGRVTVGRFLLAFALGIAGGTVALVAAAPLPWLLGSVVAVGASAMFLPGTPEVPRNMRIGFVPVIGVAIGSAFTPDILADFWRWWPSLLALCAFIPAVHMLCF